MQMSHICSKDIQRFLPKSIKLNKLIFPLMLLSIGGFCFGADEESAMEIQDLSGSTVHFSGTANTTPVTIPAVANKVISEVFFKCDYQSPTTKLCQISFDNGANYLSLAVGESIGWSAKGRIKQIRVKGSTTGVTYQGLINYEAY